MFASRSVWYLPTALLAFFFLLYASIGLWFSEWISSDFKPQHLGGLESVLSPESIDALYEDARLRRALLSLTEAMAKTSLNLGEAYDSEGLKDFGKNLTEEIERLRNVQPQKRKRGFLQDLGNMVNGGNANGNGQQQGDLLSGIKSALGISGDSGNSTGGLGGLLSQGLSSIGNSVVGELATPALFLGIGIGMGAETGLNLTDMQRSQAIATQVAASFNAQPTGLNMVAQNLGSGLSAQIAPSLGNATSGAQIGNAIFALAQGIGQGSASGLNLTQQKFQPSNGTDITAIAGNFGLGVALPIASSIDIQKLASQSGASGGQLMAQIPQIAAAAGQGLGEGASAGLGLSKQNPNPQRRQAGNSSNQIDIPGTVGDFSRGLSQSFLQSSDLSKALRTVAPGTQNGLNFDIMGMIMPIASGAGRGIGEGAAIGLGLQADTGLSTMSSNGSSTQSTEMITAEFSKGLVASFLANGTSTVVINALTSSSGGLTMNLQGAKVAEGLARGLVEGSIDAISMVGGIENVLSGNFSVDAAMNMPAMQSTNFNDSVNGSAVAFGRGLGGEGTLLIASLITNATKPAPKKRSIDIGVVPHGALSRRADSTPLAVSGNMLSSLAQAGTNAITCQGIGGMAAIGLGLMNSGTIKSDTKNPVPLDNTTLAALPKDPITIMSEGNKFQIKIQNTQITINELALLPFAILTALHIVLTTFAFFYALPAYLALGAIWRLSVLIGYPLNEADNKKWRKRILLGLFLPTSIIGTIFGLVGMGKATHFQSAHGILGLLTIILIPPTIVTSIRRLNTDVPPPPSSAFLGIKQVPKLFKMPVKVHFISAIFQQIILQFGTIAWVTGFSELRSISLCIVDAILTAPTVVGALTGILFLQVGATSLIALRSWLEQRIAKKEKEASENRGGVAQTDSKRSDATQPFDAEKNIETGRPEPQTRNTAQLLGREDSKIGWPSEVRKVGDEDPVPGRTAPVNDNPFLEPAEQNPRRVTYNERSGGYETDDRSNYEDDDGGTPRYQQFPESERESRYEWRGDEDGRTPAQQYASFSRPRPGWEQSPLSGEVIRIQYPSFVPPEVDKGSGYAR